MNEKKKGSENYLILLVNTMDEKIVWVSFGAWRGYWFSSLGVHTLIGYLNSKNDYLIHSIWYFDQDEIDIFIEHLILKQPDYLCFSVNIGYLDSAIKLILDIEKKISSDIKYVFGNREFLDINNVIKILQKFPNSLVVKGYGEEAMQNIVNYKENNVAIPNLYFLNNNVLHFTFNKEFNCNDYVSPCYEIEIINKKTLNINTTVAFIEVSRGCSKSHACSYCSNSMYPEIKNWNFLNLKEILKAIQQILIYKPLVINFVSEDFLGNNNSQVLELLNYIENLIHSIYLHKKINFYCAVRVSDIFAQKDDIPTQKYKISVLKKMKAIGFHSLYVGFESGSNSQLKRFQKDVSVAENFKAIEILDRKSTRLNSSH